MQPGAPLPTSLFLFVRGLAPLPVLSSSSVKGILGQSHRSSLLLTDTIIIRDPLYRSTSSSRDPFVAIFSSATALAMADTSRAFPAMPTRTASDLDNPNVQIKKEAPESDDEEFIIPPEGREGEALENAGDAEEEMDLANLVTIRDQDDLERDIGRQADQLLTEQADERDKKRLEKTSTTKQRLANTLAAEKKKLEGFGGQVFKNRIRANVADLEAQIDALDIELAQIQQRIENRHNAADNGSEMLPEEHGNKRLPGESRRDFLIRTGKITPFSKVPNLPGSSSNLADVMLDAEAGDEDDEEDDTLPLGEEPQSHVNLRMPGFADELGSSTSESAAPEEKRPSKRRRLQSRRRFDASAEEEGAFSDGSDSAFEPGLNDRQLAAVGQSSDEGEGDEVIDDDFAFDTPGRKRKGKGKLLPTAAKRTAAEAEEEEDMAGVDDGNEQVYQARLQKWIDGRSEKRRKERQRLDPESNISNRAADSDDEEEWFKSHPARQDAEFDGNYRIPGDIYPSLFAYQKTGVQWLSELYSQQVGGIIGDEMGLGKTIQIISFLAGLHYSKKINKPIIIVCPATVMRQWVNEFHRWWPPFRVSILHSSGSGMMNVRREEEMEDELEEEQYGSKKKVLTKSQKSAKKILDRVVRDGHVLVTTYSGLQTYAGLLINTDWGYAVLDEGHKIRNPNTSITIHCKELRTPNRVILSGTPMQNNLTELWSLFDFVFPMRLGTLVNFRNQFELPIKVGGYANASNLQVETAMKCAETLKETISPYLLQRFKVDVAADLPKKTEQVLFCKLTKLQREAYEVFLRSEEMKSIIEGKRQALYGVDLLRKICNHPDLVEHRRLSQKPDYDYGNGFKSGKMQVVKALLREWRNGGHKTLLFAQHRIMLDILEKYIKNIDGFNYRRMDGNTSIKDRQDLVDEFNRDPNLHVFLLTTKVGGLGVNLTGANRVIIYDPDWNPSTDIQARERAWRLGQKREVQIFRLMTAGTIEEKIYHRQIFKQFLTNKILRDPKQRQTFQLRDLHDLFSLGDDSEQTETASLFRGSEVKFSNSQTENANKGKENAATEGLSNIKGIARQEAYQDQSKPASNSTDPSASSEEKKDGPLLSAIFSRAGVSALDHDAILDSNSPVKRKPIADPNIIAREAKRVAAEAARELQRAGEIARTVPIGTPTWTGVVGSAGRPPSPPARGFRAGRGGRGGRGGPSSASIMANLSARQPNLSSASSRASTPQSQQGQPKGKELLTMIRDYMQAHGGRVYTQMLIDHFNRYCATPQRVQEFKEMLRQIAQLEKGVGGRGKWVLKKEYGGRA